MDVLLVLRVHGGEWKELEAAISKGKVPTEVALYFLYHCCFSFSTTEECLSKKNNLHSPVVMGWMGI